MARIAVAATAPFGADVLRRLAGRHDVATVLTRPDAPRGRGRRLAAPPAKLAAEALGVPVLQPERPAPGLPLDAPVVVVCAYGLLVPEPMLSERLWLNVHPSLLPRWRGAAPVERAILAGDATTGVTIHETVAALDAGPIAAQEAFPLDELDAGGVFDRAAEIAARLVGDVLAALDEIGDPRALAATFVPQPDEGVTYAQKIEAADRALDLARPAEELVRQVRALAPHIGARATVLGRSVTVWQAEVATDGAFAPLEVQPDGGKRMPYEAWLRGLRRTEPDAPAS